ncbi:hypothetical protein CPB84DRAFT_1748770 [Gymnopilus junonius]|uniref:DUF7702 domain-containing protein n=1 Tax=Gymnopilus junonius TaxID=109634 RepID=A0A9P5NM51_GYMJU|nr:hypothetical protein CPB84DRAFT_1748770 [Gymnopilus junonius]
MNTPATSPPDLNYATFYGIHSIPGAVVFAVLYAPLFGWFILQSFRHPTYVHVILVLFCAIRIAAFAIRAALAGSSSAGQNLGLLIADQVLFGVGYFGLLYSAYTLVLDRDLLTRRPPPSHPILRLTRNRRLFRVVLMIAVALGIASSSMTDATHTASNDSKIKSLHEASTIIFLILTVLQALQTLVFVKDEQLYEGIYNFTPLVLAADTDENEKRTHTFGDKHAMLILLVISLLLLVREVFTTVTVNNAAKQNNEHLWYPLYALPELLAVALYTAPGLVPPRSELPPQGF